MASRYRVPAALAPARPENTATSFTLEPRTLATLRRSQRTGTGDKMKRKPLLIAVGGLVLAGGAVAFLYDGSQSLLTGTSIRPLAQTAGLICEGCDRTQSAKVTPSNVHVIAQQAASGDFDGDGKSDLLLGHDANDWLAYWKLNGPQAVAYSSVFQLPKANYSTYQRTATGDFNGDGRADLLLAPIGFGVAQTFIWLADGAGGFTAVALESLAADERIVGAGDVDGDGKADLLLSTDYGEKLGYWIMSGGTVLRKATGLAIPADRPALVATGDFNGDHRVDLLWKPASSRSLVMLVGDGQAFTTAPVRDYAVGWEVWGAGDIDADGRSDILLVNPGSRFFAYWTMDGATPARYSQVFRLPGGAELPSRFGPVAVGDYNGDGRLDLVLSRQRDRSLVMWLGDGASFTEYPTQRHAPDWLVSHSFRSIGAPVQPYVDRDIDGDGRSDLVAGRLDFSKPAPHAWSTSITYHITLPRPAEYDGDYTTLRHYPTGFTLSGEQPLATGDFDGDGRLDMVTGREDAGSGARETSVSLSSLAGDGPVAIPSPVAAWQFIGSGDVDGDGRSDLLLGQNMPIVSAGSAAYNNPSMDGFAYWIMERGNVLRYSLGFLTDPAAPRLAAKGDFNGDGKLDLVWSSLPGAAVPILRMWLGDGNGFTVFTVNAPAAGWNVIAAGDIDGDGRSDLVLRNGEGAAYWLMDSARIREYSPGFLIPGTDLVGDFNGDGRADLLYLASSGTPSVTRYATVYAGDGRGFPISWIAGPVYGSGRTVTAVPRAFVR